MLKKETVSNKSKVFLIFFSGLMLALSWYFSWN